MKADIAQKLIQLAQESFYYKRALDKLNLKIAPSFIDYEAGSVEYLSGDDTNRNMQSVETTIDNVYTDKIKLSCSCHSGPAMFCLHKTMACLDFAFRLREYDSRELISMDSSELYIESLDWSTLISNCNNEQFFQAQKIKDFSFRFDKNQVLAEVEHKRKKYQLSFKYDVQTHILKTSCNCKQTLKLPLCSHKYYVLSELANKLGEDFLTDLNETEESKSEILEAYGYSSQDNFEDLFELDISDGNLKYLPKDKTIKRPEDLEEISDIFFEIESTQSVLIPNYSKDQLKDWIVCIRTSDYNPYRDFEVEIYNCKINPKTQKVTHLKSLDNSPPHILLEAPAYLSSVNEEIDKLTHVHIRSQIKAYNIDYISRYEEADPEVFAKYKIYESKVLAELWQYLKDSNVYTSDDVKGGYWYGEDLTNGRSLTAVSIGDTPLKLRLEVSENELYISLQVYVKIGDNLEIPFQELGRSVFFWFINIDNTLYRWDSFITADLADRIYAIKGGIKTLKNNATIFFENVILPISEAYDIDWNLKTEIEYKEAQDQEPVVYLKEHEDYLTIYPVIRYKVEDEEYEMALTDQSTKVSYNEGEIKLFDKGKKIKNELKDFILSTHPDFPTQAADDFLYLSFEKALEDGWLFDFYEKLNELDIKVFGQKKLKKLKYNLNKPVPKWNVSSGTDWFDLEAEIVYGDQLVTIKDIRKAVLNQQDFVQLKDGTLGVLPKEWLEKYTNLFKLGTLRKDKLKISKLHFSLIDELSSQLDDAEILEELHQKKLKIRNFKKIEKVKIPKKMNATLREYQIEGYNWLNFLDEFGWGGCLADDMGLGKTIQVLAFLQNQIDKRPKKVNLVVVPTSLIFNWQLEMDRFTPGIKYHTHYGSERDSNLKNFGDNHLVLTTYGMIRSDIEFFTQFKFNYIVLDEAHAIKNPVSQISKAVKLLKARNRITMTGTPIENNTFDLYSQFEFLNPGFLKGEAFFRAEFANKIDKNQDAEASKLLRKLIYPFMLKRTKKEVAKDLPDKTESILFCEMSKKQRKVYDAFRNDYRQKLLEKIDTEGRGKSGMLILEALTKLRQICDSASLLNDDAVYPADSIKLDILVEEIKKNASNHKILVFSQFLKMLDMVKQELDKLGIKYEYLDGSVSDRSTRVNRFQNDQQCRVFLSSLKTGGVGLNLTEADYVYLIDPWWNPAVEQQAIDRTHRIGQTKKVFAYRMICKDTIEEKILKLQEKKRALAEDLVGAETGFIKKLTRDDIVELFT